VLSKLARARNRPLRPGRQARADHLRAVGEPGLPREALLQSSGGTLAKGFRVEQRFEHDLTILAPVGELDEAAVRPFEQAFPNALARGRPVVVDLAGLTFIDSCGLWTITELCSACKRGGVSFQVWPGPERIQEVFEVTGLCDLLPFVDRPSAIAG
jgi:anti-sigma B factor antagonist